MEELVFSHWLSLLAEGPAFHIKKTGIASQDP